MAARLELEDIQAVVLRRRPMPYFGAFVLLRIDEAAAARSLIRRLIPHVASAADWETPVEEAWINIVFSCEGLRRLGVAESILEGFPDSVRQGMAARKEILRDSGINAPDHWTMPHGGNGFHAALTVMAGSEAQRDEKIEIGRKALEGLGGVVLIQRQDVGVPPTLREHFGFADGISKPFIEGEGGTPLPGQGEPVKAGEFILGYENEIGEIATGPGPAAFWRNGTYISLRKIAQNVALFRKFLRDNADTPEGQELVAAKMMGRWRSGCPLALSPLSDDPELAKDKSRNNDFAYYEDDPNGLKTPMGCHTRRLNPRDALKDTATQVRLHQVLRRGTAYGPPLPEDVLEDDGIERGLILAVLGTAPERQFEFVQAQWINNGDFISQGSRTDPILGSRDMSNDYVYPAKPVRRHLTGLPEFTVTKGGEYVFLPGLGGLRWLANGDIASP